VTAEKHPRRGGITLLGTARDPDQAGRWQDRLRDAGIQSIVRGHRPEGSAEARPSFSGADVYVSASALARARGVLGSDLPPELTPEPAGAFPWLWLAIAPAAVMAVGLVGLLIVLLR
jgi:hypothetical protein